MGLALRQSCGPGTLSVCQHGEDRSLAFPLACIGSGGAVLLLADETAQARQASRRGAADFIVDTLSEALRILKNELRQRRSVAVALVGSVEANTVAMEERGVQPQCVEIVQGNSSLWSVLVRRGAVPIVSEEVKQQGVRGAALEQLTLEMHGVAGLAQRRLEDEKLRQVLTAGREQKPGPAHLAAQQWMRVAPRLFLRDCERAFWRPHHEENAR